MAIPRQYSQLPIKKPKAKAKPAKPATATKPSLSSEFVVDSDHSGDAKTASVKKPASKSTKFQSSSVEPAAPKVLSSQTKPSKKWRSPSLSPAKGDPSGGGSGSTSGSEDERRSPKEKIPAAQDGNPTPKPKKATARPVLAKPSIKSSTNIKPMDQKKDRESGATRKQSNSEAGGSSECSSSGSESDRGSESESGSSDETSLQSPENKSPVQESVTRHLTPIYEPPAGFNSASISLHPASKLSLILAPSNLQGKQIWHITAPASVPISLVKEVSTQDIANGASVLEYHGAKYGLVPESEAEQASSRALLLPSSQTNNYRPSHTTIIKTLHLQQLVSLPSYALDPAVHPNRSASASESYRKAPRQQPEGLRMRYRPFGIADDSDLESSSETRPKAPEFHIPTLMEGVSAARKRKRPESNDASSDVGFATNSEKRKQSSQASAGAKRNPIDIDGISDKRSNGAESPTKSPRLGPNGFRPNGNLPNGNETKEERRKRKGKDKSDRQQPMPLTALPLDVRQDAATIQPGEVIENVPAIANAVEGASTANSISPHKDSKEEKAKRREGRRRRKEAERASKGASLISAADVSHREVAHSQDQMMQEIETAQREASIQIPTPGDRSPQEQSITAHDSHSDLRPSQTLQRTETKEERAKRKEEKRRRKMESRSA